jgi:hypothetical protein
MIGLAADVAAIVTPVPAVTVAPLWSMVQLPPADEITQEPSDDPAVSVTADVL